MPAIRGRRCVMTPLTRKVTRRSSETYRDRSKLRRIVDHALSHGRHRPAP